MQQKEIIERLKTIPTGDLTDSMRRLGISGYTKGIYCLQGKPTPNMVGQWVIHRDGKEEMLVPNGNAFCPICRLKDYACIQCSGLDLR